MIPYFQLTTLSFGPFHIYVWGLMVAFGFLVTLSVAEQRAKESGLAASQLLNLGVWIIIAAFIGARIFHVFFYDWQNFFASPLDIFKIWQGGLSSFGGFAGAALAAILYTRIKKLNFRDYADALMYAFPLGLGIGRLGCFFNHLHLGKLSNSPFAVAFPGGSRLDMGLIESLFGFLLFGIYFFFLRTTQKKIFLPLTMLLYGTVRFIFDFGRATDITKADARYAGLTPAQYGSLLLIALALYLFLKLYYHKQTNQKNFKITKNNV